MPGPRRDRRAPATPRPLPDGQAASARGAAPDGEDGAPRGAPKPDGTGNAKRRGRAASKKPEVALRDLLQGLRAGDLESVLLTVAMAAEENRMPSPDADEVQRILAFLARLAEYDAVLPPCAGVGPKGLLDAD